MEVEVPFERGDQRRKVVLGHFPNLTIVDPIVLVCDSIAHSTNFLERDSRKRSGCYVGYVTRSLTDNIDPVGDGVPRSRIVPESIKRHAFHILLNCPG